MKIYTRTGDDGTTGLYGGRRVGKDDARVEAYGCLDELNAVIGHARVDGLPPAMDEELERIQGELFVMGAEIASGTAAEAKLNFPLLDGRAALRLEGAIDHAEGMVQPLRHFVLPAGTHAATTLHVARTVARRFERRLVTLSREAHVREPLLQYINRLGDLLFVYARWANRAAGIADVPWSATSRSTNE